MNRPYPISLDELDSWAQQNGVALSEARVRFVQYALLTAIANSRALSANLAFKGGNALDFFWARNRSTKDLDFTAITSIPFDKKEELRNLVEKALRLPERRLGIRLRVQSLQPKPSNRDSTFTTYVLQVGYGFPGDHQRIHDKLSRGRCPQAVPIEVSNNDVIYEATPQQFVDDIIQVSTLNDIVAEKLRALLQQPIRNRKREQDLLDIAFVFNSAPQLLDRNIISQALLEKSKARNVAVSKPAFRNDEVRSRAREDYDELRSTARTFIPFEVAYSRVLVLVDSLFIPDE